MIEISKISLLVILILLKHVFRKRQVYRLFSSQKNVQSRRRSIEVQNLSSNTFRHHGKREATHTKQDNASRDGVAPPLLKHEARVGSSLGAQGLGIPPPEQGAELA